MLSLGFQALKTANLPGGSQILDTQIQYIAKAFRAIEQAVGAPNGLADLDATGLIALASIEQIVTPATLHVTATAAANTAVTATLPAVGGKKHAIVALQLVRASAAPVVGAAVLVTTSANLPGNPAWSAGNLIAAGQSITDLDYQPANPLLATSAGVATTVVMPAAGLGVVNRINISYLLVDA